MRQSWPWYSPTRSGGGWFVKLNGDQIFLGKHPKDSPKPKKKSGKWEPPAAITSEFYNLMALRNTTSQSDYSLETICARFIQEKETEDTDLAKRYEQVLGKFCDHEFQGQRVGKLLVNGELDSHHLQSWIDTFKSTQTQRTYVSNVRAALNWAAKRKDINITKSPFADFKPPRIESRLVVISKDEHEGLLRFWGNDCYCDFLQALWYTGARPGEIAKVEKRHFNKDVWKLDPTEHKTGRATDWSTLVELIQQ